MSRGRAPWDLLGEAHGRYDGEAITQLQHGLQAAAWGEREGASTALCLAALFHDVGHLLVEDAGAMSRAGRDDRHERSGAALLARWFGPEISEPVRLHVDAKRWLARDPAYVATLSEESVRSLALQGGPFDDEDAAAFLATPYARDALRLRRWDDLAKDPDARPPGLASWVPRARALALG